MSNQDPQYTAIQRELLKKLGVDPDGAAQDYMTATKAIKPPKRRRIYEEFTANANASQSKAAGDNGTGLGASNPLLKAMQQATPATQTARKKSADMPPADRAKLRETLLAAIMALVDAGLKSGIPVEIPPNWFFMSAEPDVIKQKAINARSMPVRADEAKLLVKRKENSATWQVDNARYLLSIAESRHNAGLITTAQLENLQKMLSE